MNCLARSLGGLSLALAAVAATAHGGEDPSAPLRVATAISLKPFVERRAAEYRERHEVRIEIHAGGSTILGKQIERGAPFDLLIAASADEMDAIEEAGLIDPPTRREVARNSLVVVTAPDGPRARILHDLLRAEFELIAVANPRTAPLGRYTRTALDHLDLYDALSRRLVYGENARQVIEYVASGQVPAAIVYRSDAVVFASRVVRGPDVPVEASGRIRYDAAVLSDAGRPALALAFLDDLTSAAAVEQVRESGLIPPR